MDTGNALDNTQVWAQHVVRWGTATSGDAVASGDGLIAQMPVFIVTDPHSDVLLAREVSWMIVDAFSALRAAHPDGPLVRHVHDLWRDITRGIARRVAEATILKNGGGIGDVDDVRLAGLIATRIEDRPTWIAVSSGGMGIVTVDEKGAAEPLPQFDDVGYDLPGDLWTIPMEAGQRFVVATERVRAKLTGNQALVALGQLKRAERAASTVLSQAVAGAGTGADQAILVIDVLTPEDEAALASPPTLEGEAEPESDLPASQLSGSWGLEALGIDHSVRPRAPRRSHTAPPVLDDFHFVSYLGSGGFSDVYLYEEQLPKRLVAIKVLSRTALGEGDSSQFRDEVDLMAQLSGHPSVVEIHDANVAESGQPYVVMQYCPMPSLAERLANGPLAIEDALKMGVQVASAVHTAHVMGIVHHDLKPANVLYSQFGRPLLGDFGIATLVGATNQDVMGASLPWARGSRRRPTRPTTPTPMSAWTRCSWPRWSARSTSAPPPQSNSADSSRRFRRPSGTSPRIWKFPSSGFEACRTTDSKVRGIFLIRAKIGVFFASARPCGYDWRHAGGILPYLPRRGGLGRLLVAGLVAPVASTRALSAGEKQ